MWKRNKEKLEGILFLFEDGFEHGENNVPGIFLRDFAREQHIHPITIIRHLREYGYELKCRCRKKGLYILYHR